MMCLHLLLYPMDGWCIKCGDLWVCSIDDVSFSVLYK